MRESEREWERVGKSGREWARVGKSGRVRERERESERARERKQRGGGERNSNLPGLSNFHALHVLQMGGRQWDGVPPHPGWFRHFLPKICGLLKN